MRGPGARTVRHGICGVLCTSLGEAAFGLFDPSANDGGTPARKGVCSPSLARSIPARAIAEDARVDCLDERASHGILHLTFEMAGSLAGDPA
jgi:hypothetical protein